MSRVIFCCCYIDNLAKFTLILLGIEISLPILISLVIGIETFSVSQSNNNVDYIGIFYTVLRDHFYIPLALIGISVYFVVEYIGIHKKKLSIIYFGCVIRIILTLCQAIAFISLCLKLFDIHYKIWIAGLITSASLFVFDIVRTYFQFKVLYFIKEENQNIQNNVKPTRYMNSAVVYNVSASSQDTSEPSITFG